MHTHTVKPLAPVAAATVLAASMTTTAVVPSAAMQDRQYTVLTGQLSHLIQAQQWG